MAASFPPGLEPVTAVPAPNKSDMIDEAATEMRKVAIDSIESELKKLGDTDNRDAIVAAVRKVVLADVDSRVKEKAEELWLKGKNMLSSIQTKHKEKTQVLADDLTECLKKQQLLEAENQKLKMVLADLAGRFSMMGSCFNGASPKTAYGGAGGMSAAASTMSPNQESTPSELYSPATFTPSTAEAGKAAETGALASQFPDLPAFPFPAAQAASPAPALSLADALLQTPQPISLASSMTPVGTPVAGDMHKGQDNGSNSYTFSFTLRKADGADLGLNVSHHEHDRVLRVEGVRSDGAVEAWNRQCASSAFADKAVLPGDIITSVNNITYDPKTMLEECRDRQLLKLTILRQRAERKSSTLRADASEFVPGAASSSSDAEDPPSAAEDAAAADAEDAIPKPDEE